MKLKKHIFINSFFWAVGFTLISFSGFFLYIKLLSQNHISHHSVKTQLFLENALGSLQAELNNFESLTKYFAKDYSVERIALNQATPISFSSLVDKNKQLLSQFPKLIGFKILNLHGQELFAIERQNGQIIEKNRQTLNQENSIAGELQTIADNQIYRSSFEINPEKNASTVASVPQMRFVTPVLVEGARRGYVLFTADFAALFNNFLSEIGTSKTNLFILDHLGGWLAGNSDLNFAHFQKETRLETFGKYYPKTFAQLEAGTQGSLHSSEGSFFAQIFPLTTNKNLYFVERTNSVLEAGNILYVVKNYGLHLISIFVSSFILLVIGLYFARSSLEQRLFLKQSLAFLKNADVLSQLGYWSLNVHTQRTFLSPHLKSLFGLQESERVDFSKCLSVFEGKMAKELQDSFESLKTSMKPFDITASLRIAEGKVLWIRITGRVQEVRQGSVVSLSGLIQDVTELRNSLQNEPEKKLKMVV